jgi:hypothetical protein
MSALARGGGVGQRLHLDAFSGLSGDMFAAALLDLGLPLAPIEEALATLSLGEVRLEHAYVERSGIRARRFVVHAPEEEHERTHGEIVALLEPLPVGVRDRARAAFRVLAEAEAEVHGVEVDDVHFHEVGAIDSIVDIVAVAASLEYLGAEVSCSPLPLGHGTVRSRHGILPLPAPATVACLRGIPTYDGGAAMELVTPTGACLVRTAATSFSRWPALRARAIGWGAGARELPDRPNVLRVVLGDPVDRIERRTLTLLETNLDDATPELIAHALDRLRELGARDAWATSVTMKKGRMGTLVSVLVDPPRAEEMAAALMGETSTLGVRAREVTRFERPRRVVTVETRYGPIEVKIADGDGLPVGLKPEHDACAAAAREHGARLSDVVDAARIAARGALDED